MGFPVSVITLTGTTIKMPVITLRPNGAGCLTELIPNAGNNWECVDETIEDEDASYVYTVSISEKEDLYTIPTLSHIGTITSIKVISYAKSDLNSPSLSAIYALILTDNACSDIYESVNFDLSTDYKKYSYTWFTNPRTGVAWTWGNIDNLQIGIKCSSPSLFNVSTNLIIRPDGNGTYQQLESHGLIHYTLIDEIVSDEDNTIIDCKFNAPNVWYYDTYTMPSHTTETGVINSVTVWARCKATGGYSDICKTRTAVYIGGTLGIGTIYNLSHSYANYSNTWTINPDTGVAWIWNDIDNLEIGLGLWTDANGTPCRVTQIWCVINYNKTFVNPEIRTTQEYAEIRTTQNLTCLLPSPIDVEVNQQIETNGLNFWSGNREVYAQGRTSKRTTLSGLMWDGCTDGVTSCEDIIACIRALGKYQNPISITGLRYPDLNTDYNILSFGWKRVNKRPNCYTWNIELEWCN